MSHGHYSRNSESIYRRVPRINRVQAEGDVHQERGFLERAVSGCSLFKVGTFTTLWGNYGGILQVSLRLRRTFPLLFPRARRPSGIPSFATFSFIFPRRDFLIRMVPRYTTICTGYTETHVKNLL